MDQSSNNITAVAKMITQEAYEGYVVNLVSLSALSLLVYTTILNFTREVEYIWLKPFSLPSLLYVFTRYSGLISHGLYYALNSLPLEGRACNILADVVDVSEVLGYLGVQGLLIIRTYALCRGNKIVAGLLIPTFFAALVLDIFGISKFNGCIFIDIPAQDRINLVENILTIVMDVIVFCACSWKVWGTWRLRSEVNSRDSGSGARRGVVSILFRQIVSGFCFVIVTTVIGTLIQPFVKSSLVLELEYYQEVLAIVLISDFVLDLRQHNAAIIQESGNGSLSAIHFRSTLQHVHRSIIAELGEHHEIARDGVDSIDLVEFPGDGE